MVPWRCRARCLQEALTTSLHVLVACWLLSGVLGGEMCTKSVPVQRQPSKKVHVLRRVPASCSNWEKAWAWITKKDCGTKYRLDLVDVPSEKKVTYRVVKTCCEGDTKCIEAQQREADSGLVVGDEKFLAIVLGSTAAALVVLGLIISISLYRKRKQCTAFCEERRHMYISAEDAEEFSEQQEQKNRRIDDEETEAKVCESEYAEISDCGLPRYADIFKETEDQPDPFTQATAPPMCMYETGGAHRRAGASGVAHHADHDDIKHGRQAGPHSVQASGPEEVDTPLRAVPQPAGSRDYYNSSEHAQQGGGAVPEEAMLALTKDDPVVVTSIQEVVPSPCPASIAPCPVSHATSSNSNSSSSSESCDVTHDVAPSLTSQLTTTTTTTTSSTTNSNNESRDVSYDTTSSPPSASQAVSSMLTSPYDHLAGEGDKEGHEYQPLVDRTGCGAGGARSKRASAPPKKVAFLLQEDTVISKEQAKVSPDC